MRSGWYGEFVFCLVRAKYWLLWLFISFGCGDNEEVEGSRIITANGAVIDARIHSEATDSFFYAESESLIGHNQGFESRLLLFFPEIDTLYRDDVLLGSITALEVILYSEHIHVNPENIILYPVTEAWTAFVTWTHRLSFAGTSLWQTPGGSFDIASGVSAAIRGTESSTYKELSFDITSLMTARISSGLPNYGFILTVKMDAALNHQDQMTFSTYNHDKFRPVAVLAFSTKDIVEP